MNSAHNPNKKLVVNVNVSSDHVHVGKTTIAAVIANALRAVLPDDCKVQVFSQDGDFRKFFSAEERTRALANLQLDLVNVLDVNSEINEITSQIQSAMISPRSRDRQYRISLLGEGLEGTRQAAQLVNGDWYWTDNGTEAREIVGEEAARAALAELAGREKCHDSITDLLLGTGLDRSRGYLMLIRDDDEFVAGAPVVARKGD